LILHQSLTDTKWFNRI